MTIKKIISESIEKNPVGLAEAFKEEITERLRLALEAKHKNEEDEYEDDEDEDDK